MNENIINFNNGLEVDEAVDAIAKNNDPETIRNFFMKAENTNFLVPYRDAVNTIPLFNSKDGLKLIPAFSSYTAFEKSPLEKDKVQILHFDKINDIVKNSSGQIGGIIINPHGKSIVFRHNAANAPKPEKKPGVKLMKPAFIPENVANAMKQYFAENGKVYSAYMLWSQRENDLAPHLFVVVDFDGTPAEFFPKVAEAIKPSLSKGNELEFAKADFKLLKTAEKLVAPFYKKS